MSCEPLPSLTDQQELDWIKDRLEIREALLDLQKGLEGVSLKLAQLTKFTVMKFAEVQSVKEFEGLK